MSDLIAAFTFGLAAGLNPGPLGVFVIHQTMSKGYRSGMIAALIPFLTDLPIALLVILLTLQLGETQWFIVVVSLVGSLYLAWLAYKIFSSPHSIDPSKLGLAESEESDEIGRGSQPIAGTSNKVESKASGEISWFSGLKMNFLNPVPYIFGDLSGGLISCKGRF